MKNYLFIISIVLPQFLFSQNCDCVSNFKWVKEIFEENDAGFSYALEVNGVSAYEDHNSLFVNRLQKVKDQSECLVILNEWLSFFRSGHLRLRPLNQESDLESNLSDTSIIDRYKDSPSLDINLNEFENYLRDKEKIDYEGIWISEPYKLGVKKINHTFIGFVIEADGQYWKKGQIKFEINSDNSTVYYMRDHSEVKFEAAELWGLDHIIFGFVNLRRAVPTSKNNPEIDRYFKSLSSNKPYFEVIDENTTYLRIPSFGNSEKTKIDSVIQSNMEIITNKQNLIIDIRNNGGGSDRSYEKILPILYTNPIRKVGMEFLSTELNNQRMSDFTNNPEHGFNEEEIQYFKESLDKLSNNIGEFVNLDSTEVEIETFNTVYNYPENIGIIINEYCGSTSEQFLLAARQSKKVKLFGSTTAGVLDISNMNFVNSPCNEYQLGYCLSKSMRIPEMVIDGKGIQPDYYLGKGLKKYQWLEQVTKILND